MDLKARRLSLDLTPAATGRPVRKPRNPKPQKPIIVDTLHLDDIDAALNAVQSRSRERLVTVKDVLDTTEKLFDLLSIPKNALNGCTFDVDLYAQHLPWRSSLVSTQFSLKFKRNTWYLTGVARTFVHSTKVKIISNLTEEAKAALIDKYLRIKGDLLNGMETK